MHCETVSLSDPQMHCCCVCVCHRRIYVCKKKHETLGKWNLLPSCPHTNQQVTLGQMMFKICFVNLIYVVKRLLSKLINC